VADQEKDDKVKEYSQSAYIGEIIPNSPSDFREETACELTGRVSLKKSPSVPASSVNREETSRELAVVPVSLKKAPIASAANREETSHELAVVPVSLKKDPATAAVNREETASEIAVPVKPLKHLDNREETAAEIAAPVSLGQFRKNNNASEDAQGGAQAGTGIGFLALALSIISLFVMPILFGAAGIVLGFIARARGASSTGAWAIGIGVVSIVIGIFIIPFF
jgi:hypothetical protein